MKEKPTVGSPFFRTFPTDHIPKVMKDINVHFFILYKEPTRCNFGSIVYYSLQNYSRFRTLSAS